MDWFAQGGAAFPIPHSNGAGAPGSEHGMSLRDWFAGQALTGMGTWLPDYNGTNNDLRDRYAHVERAKWAYAQADAMLAERAK